MTPIVYHDIKDYKITFGDFEIMAAKKTTKKAAAKAEQQPNREQPARFMDCVDSHGRLMADVDAAVKKRVGFIEYERGNDKPNHHDLAQFLERARAVVKKIEWPLSILEKSDPKHANAHALKRMKDEIETMFRNLPEPDKK